MKKKKFKFIAAASAVFLSSVAYSGETIHIAIETLSGIRHGTLNEYVYGTDFGGYRKISELDWQIKNIFYLGGKISADYKIFSLSFRGGGFFPKNSGVMEDSDWLNYSSEEIKTTYSISENKLNRGGFFGTDFSSSFNFFPWLEIKPELSFCFEHFDFSANNGYGWYGQGSSLNPINPPVAWNNEQAVFYEKGKLNGIDYSRSNYMFWLGFETVFKPFDFLEITAGIRTSPFSITDSLDTHFGNSNNKYYYDFMYGFFKGWKVSSCAVYKINGCFSVKAQAEYTAADIMKGKTYQSYSPEGPFKKSSTADSACAASYWDWTLSFIYRPF